uniref:Alpha-mannosidase n=1 Tax=Syphacia muris TaxID=451379 RepID=A0A0N5ARF2_9BILA
MLCDNFGQERLFHLSNLEIKNLEEMAVRKILKEKENAEQALQLAKEEVQAREGVLQLPQDIVNNKIDTGRGGKVAAIDRFLENVHSSTLKTGNDTCSFSQRLTVSQNDLQMLNIYESLPFDDPDGGVWKQGWPITYSENEVKRQRKLEVVVVPHSHTDPGWIKTFEEYYHQQTKNILDEMLTFLTMYKDMRFVYAEMSFFEQWWADIDDKKRDLVKKLLKDGQLEILTGGWVMPDEANSHYFGIITQLLEGHEWIRNHLGEEFAPVNHWSIDPFGLSPTVAYIVARANLSSGVVQRVHYAVKKYLAKNKQLEFKWRQFFTVDHHGDDFLTHVMPFFSYDVPHTCGPDPKVCCQFDFRRLPGSDILCPWNVPPEEITDSNCAARAFMLYDQYRKKAQLFKTNVVFVPLGDDFRYDTSFEWEKQHANYQKLFDYMNRRLDWNVHARFGTPAEYFKLVRERLFEDSSEFPVLTGDFFTYSDRNDHYWSGYYTSRPFYKQMDRTAQHFLRSAEILYSLAMARYPGESLLNELFNLLVEARRYISLFQHHDGVTGTAKNYVVVDYGQKMLMAIKNCEKVISAASNALLQQKSDEGSAHEFFNLDEVRVSHDALPVKIVADDERDIILFNSLAQDREEVVCINVKKANFIIRSARNPLTDVLQQIAPVIITQDGVPSIASDRYEVSPVLCFYAFVPSFGFEKYQLLLSNSSSNKVTLKTSVLLKTSEFFVDGLPESEIVLSNEVITAKFDPLSGFMKSVTRKGEDELHVDVSFVSYGARGKSPEKFNGGDDLSGAYLFLPDGPAKPINSNNIVIVIDGPIAKQVLVTVVEKRLSLEHSATVYFNTPHVLLRNFVNITSMSNFEVAMHLNSDIQNGEYFATDLNGFQMIKRRRFAKLPLQAQFYPMPGAAFIQDDKNRLSLLGAQANGVASLKPGSLEVMLDRRLLQDDGRGLFSGVTDNKKTMSSFILLVESMNGTDKSEAPIYFHSIFAHRFSLQLHYPIMSIFANKDERRAKTYSGLSSSLPCDFHVVTLRTMASPTVYGEQSSRSYLPSNLQALVIHRLGVDCRPKINTSFSCSLAGGQLKLLDFLRIAPKKITETSLTLLHEKLTDAALNLIIDPMEIRSFKDCRIN